MDMDILVYIWAYLHRHILLVVRFDMSSYTVSSFLSKIIICTIVGISCGLK